MFAIVIEGPELEFFVQPGEILRRMITIGGPTWLISMAVLVVVGFFLAFLYSAFAYRSAGVAARRVAGGMVEGFRDLALLPSGIRRIWAIAILSIKEAIRRKILYVFLLFAIPFLFAGWYLPNSPEGQLQFYVAFVNIAITYFLLPLVVFLVSLSLPNDIKNRTIQTVVTKPIRRIEIVTGRVLGFMAIFTVILAVMGTISLIYLRSQLSPEVRESQWTARVPIYSSPYKIEYLGAGPTAPEALRPLLVFLRDGKAGIKGTHVGKEWDYRSHIEGNVPGDQARWYFRFDPEQFANNETGFVRLELTFDIAKTTKGNPSRPGAKESGVFCGLQILDHNNRENDYQAFPVNHSRVTPVNVPARLFKSGELEVIARCLTTNQFLGMAPADLYFLADEKPFEWNFVKGMISVWLKLLLLTCLAVSASTVLKGFVTVLFTVMIYTLGLQYQFLVQLVTGQIPGGGPIESLIRLVTQNNQMSELDQNIFNQLALAIDQVMLLILNVLARIVPDLSRLNTVNFVAEGFDIPGALVLTNVVTIVAYVIPVMVAGFFLLRAREIAA